MKINPITLESENIRLEPMEINHLDSLCEIGLEAEIWQVSPIQINSKEKMRFYIEEALTEQKKGVSLPFVTVVKSSNKIVGSTRFGNIDFKNRKTEIGWTWINPRWQRTFVNTETKLLMLTHAFEVWNCIRVEFKTDALNEKSRNAILRIGAKQEGVLRNHLITGSGRFRDSVYFSIINTEWFEVKKNLKNKLRKY